MKQESSFWTDLLKKVLKIILKSVGGEQPKTRNQHVVPHEDGWAVRGAGNERYTAIFPRQSQAIDRAREIARNYEADVVIHREDGTIRDRINNP